MKTLIPGAREFLLALGLNSLPLLLAAQERIEIGTRVRITGETVSNAVASTTTGSVLALRADSLWLQPENRTDPLSLPLSSIRLLEVSMGRSSQGGRGARTGALVGGIALATASYIEARACEPAPEVIFFGACTPEGTAIVLGLVLGGAIGGGIGYLIGSRFSTERWRVVPLAHLPGASVQITAIPLRLSVGVAPPAGRKHD